MKKLISTLLAIAMVMMLCVAGIAEGAPAYIAENAAELTGEITFYTAFAGALYAHFVRFISPETFTQEALSVPLLTMVLFG